VIIPPSSEAKRAVEQNIADSIRHGNAARKSSSTPREATPNRIAAGSFLDKAIRGAARLNQDPPGSTLQHHGVTSRTDWDSRVLSNIASFWLSTTQSRWTPTEFLAQTPLPRCGPEISTTHTLEFFNSKAIRGSDGVFLLFRAARCNNCGTWSRPVDSQPIARELPHCINVANVILRPFAVLCHSLAYGIDRHESQTVLLSPPYVVWCSSNGKRFPLRAVSDQRWIVRFALAAERFGPSRFGKRRFPKNPVLLRKTGQLASSRPLERHVIGWPTP
jgi:hypothetical protein